MTDYKMYKMQRSQPGFFLILTFLVVLFCIFLIFSIGETSTYYVDAIEGNDSNNGLSEAIAWQSINKVNNSKFQPGDNILFKRGIIWREQLNAPSSGAVGNLITFGSYGTGDKPIINGTDNITGNSADWTYEQSNIWSRLLTIEAKIVIFNSLILGVRDNVLDAKYEFYWDTNKLYVYSVGNPVSCYTTIEAGQRGCVITNDKDYIKIENLHLVGGQLEGGNTSPGGCIFISKNSNKIIIQNNKISKCHGGGVRVRGGDNVDIKYNDISYIDYHKVGTAGDGIEINWELPTEKTPQNILIEGNTIHGYIDRQGIAVLDCETISILNNAISDAESQGIDIEPNKGSNQGVKNANIRGNTISNVGKAGISASGENTDNIIIAENQIKMTSNNRYGIGVGNNGTTNIIEKNRVFADRGIRVNGATAIVRYNYISRGVEDEPDNADQGILVKSGGNAKVYNNIISGNFSCCLELRDDGSKVDFYNNDCYNYYDVGIYIVYGMVKGIIKNNIFFHEGTFNHHLNKLNLGSIIILDYNLYYPSGNFFRWEGTTYNFSDFKTATNQELHGIVANPLFMNASGNFSKDTDFQIKSTSPAIDAGIDLNMISDYAGKSSYDVLSIENTGSKGNYLKNYIDIGAYEYDIKLSPPELRIKN